MTHLAPSVAERFPTSVSSGPPTPAQKEASATFRERIVAASQALEDIPNKNPRDAAIAQTALEDALMRGNRAIFNPPKENHS